MLAVVVLASCEPGRTVAPMPVIRTASVLIPAFRFEPAELEVSRGTVVSWENRDDDRHVIANSPTGRIIIGGDGSYDLRGSMFQFTLDPGATASFTFNQVGTYHYFCLVHNVMRGDVVVR